jgi:hypothetical protein
MATFGNIMKQSNPYFDINANYGAAQNMYDSPYVEQFMSPEAPGGEWERLLTDQGLGGSSKKDTWARNQYGRSQQGFEAAQLNSGPGLSYRTYLQQFYGPRFFDANWAKLAPTQRGENYGNFAPRARWIPW